MIMSLFIDFRLSSKVYSSHQSINIKQVFSSRYNNKTYRIDDIDWDCNPQNVFKKADGSEISFIDYYKMVQSPNLLEF